MGRRLCVRPAQPDEAVLREALTVLQRGGVVAYPTDTVYGLAVDALQPAALTRLYEVKRRPADKAFPIIIGDRQTLLRLVGPLRAGIDRLVAAFWPGALTLLMPPRVPVPPLLLGAEGCVGVRWPSLTLAQQLPVCLGRPVTATSANLSGAPVARTADDVAAQLGDAVDLILDGGETSGTVVSTVLDVSVDPPRLCRPGKVSVQDLEAVLGQRLNRSVETPL